MFKPKSCLQPTQVFRQHICFPPALPKWRKQEHVGFNFLTMIIRTPRSISLWCSFTLKCWVSTCDSFGNCLWCLKTKAFKISIFFIPKNEIGGLALLLKPLPHLLFILCSPVMTLPLTSWHFLWHIKVKLLEDRNNMSIVRWRVNTPFQGEN